MAKASEADLKMAMELTSAFESLMDYRAMPGDAQSDDPEEFDFESPADCYRALRGLFDIAEKGSLMRVVWGMAVLLDPVNEVVDPNSGVLDVHPKYSVIPELLAALVNARHFIATDRASLVECCTGPAGEVDEYDASAIATYDELLAQIDASIAKADGL